MASDGSWLVSLGVYFSAAAFVWYFGIRFHAMSPMRPTTTTTAPIISHGTWRLGPMPLPAAPAGFFFPAAALIALADFAPVLLEGRPFEPVGISLVCSFLRWDTARASRGSPLYGPMLSAA